MKAGISLFLCLLLSSSISFAEQVGRNVPDSKHNYKEVTIEIEGLEEPFQALHVSDSHIARIDKRDFSRLGARFNKRASQKYCHLSEVYLMDAVHYVESHDDMLMLHTGDLMDFYSGAGLDFAAFIFKRVRNCIACVGNHEFMNDVGKTYLPDSRVNLRDSVQTAFPNDITFFSRVYKGINFVAIDNLDSQVSEEVFRKMRKEVKKGYPIVLLCHVPFYCPDGFQKRLADRKGKSGGCAGAPLEITQNYAYNPAVEEWRSPRVYEKSSDTTLKFIEWLRKQPCLKAILCGHNHRRYTEKFSDTVMQYAVPAGYDGCADIINFVPASR